MDSLELEGQIRIMKEYLAGTDKQLQQISKNSKVWVNCPTPNWNFKNKRYRLVEKPQKNNRILSKFINDTCEKNIVTLNSSFRVNKDGFIRIPNRLLKLLNNLKIEEDELVDFVILVNKEKKRKR